jgi:hypothetical protein
MIAALMRIDGVWQVPGFGHITGAMRRAWALSHRPCSPHIEVWRVEWRGAHLPAHVGDFDNGVYTRLEPHHERSVARAAAAAAAR